MSAPFSPEFTSPWARLIVRCERWRSILAKRRTPGMDAEFEAWWGLVLACLGRPDEAAERASTATAVSGRTEIAGLVPWIEMVSQSCSEGGTATRSCSEAFRISLQTGNIDAFVASYRACKGVLQGVATDKSTHRELRLVLSRANDQRFGGIDRTSRPRNAFFRSALTKREEDVLALLVQGATNKEIARALFITEQLRRCTSGTSTPSSVFAPERRR